MGLSDRVKTRLASLQVAFVSPALPQMQLGPEDSTENPLMIQFFTWGASHPEMSWWDHFAEECPRLAELGITQAWLPPPNKAMAKVIRSSYDSLCSLTSRRTVLVMMPMICGI